MAGKELLYLRSTGQQYIDTGYIPNERTRVVCRAIVKNTSGTNWVFGARQSSSSNLFTFAFSTNGYFSAGYNNQSKNFDKSYNTEQEITVEMGVDVDFDPFCQISTEHGKESVSFNSAEETFECPCSLTLFAGNTNGNVTKGRVTIFSVTIFNDGYMKKDLVPWMHADGRVGMLDKLSGAFYYNMGDGVFEYEELPEQGGDISYMEFTTNPKYRQFPFEGLAGWKLYNHIFGGADTQTVTFDQKRFLDEPDGFYQNSSLSGLWRVSDYVPTIAEILSADCAFLFGKTKVNGYCEKQSSLAGYGYVVRIVGVPESYANAFYKYFGLLGVVTTPLPGVVEKAGMYLVADYPLDEERRTYLEGLEEAKNRLTITFP